MDEPMDIELPPPLNSCVVHYGAYVSNRLQHSLRRCQIAALNGLLEWFQRDETKNQTAVVVMPTGSGKTGVICSLPYWFGKEVKENRLDINLNQPILVITPGLNILDQMRKEFKNEDFRQKPCFLERVGAIKDVGNELRSILYSVRVTKSTAEVDNLRRCQENIVLTNVDKWSRRKKDTPTWRSLDDDLFSIIIVDEAHHLPAPQWKNIIDKFHRHAKVIFFTATPFRTDGREITDSINKNGFAYILEDKEAIEKRIIRKTEFDSNLIKFGIRESNCTCTALGRDYLLTDEYKQCTKQVVDKVIEKIQSKDQDHPLPDPSHHCAMILTVDTYEADWVFKYCQEKAQRMVVVCVHSDISKIEEKRNKKLIEEESVRVFVIVKKLLEGFDYPSVSVVGIVSPIRSPLVFAQFIGRARCVIREESKEVVADIITHEIFEQEKPYKTFKSGHLIRSSFDEADEAEISEEADMYDKPDGAE